MSIYSVIWHFFSNFYIFWHFVRKWPIQSTKYYHIRDQQVNFSRNRHLTCLVSKILFLAAILIFFENAVRHIAGSYRLISLILNSKQRKTTFYLPTNFEENRSKIATVRVPQRKSAKMAAMTSSFGNFKIRGKRTSQISVRSFVENFIKIDPSVWAGELPHTDRQTDRQTDTHTHTHTHTLGSIATYSVKLTEYENYMNFSCSLLVWFYSIPFFLKIEMVHCSLSAPGFPKEQSVKETMYAKNCWFDPYLRHFIIIV